MARNLEPKGKIVRRFGINIFGSDKFNKILDRKPNMPGKDSSYKRKKSSVYGTQLMEKQKLKFMYGLLERQFRKYFKLAARTKGITGENLIEILERRLDNVVYRMHIGSTRDQARQLVGHRHILVNDKIVDIPSYQVKDGDRISVKEKSLSNVMIKESLKKVGTTGVVPWVDVNADSCSGTFKQAPRRNEIPDLAGINEQLVVELYSK